MMNLAVSWEIVSRTMGVASILIWLCAQVPQVWTNYRLKSVEGLSVGFLLAWIAGDVANLVGCVMTGQLGVQILLAVYFVSMDLILTIQFYLYRDHSDVTDAVIPVYSNFPHHYPVVHGISMDTENSNRRPSDIQDESSSKLKLMRNRLASVISITTLMSSIRGGSALPIDKVVTQDQAIEASQKLRLFSIVAAGLANLEMDTGMAIAYFSSIMYLSSRIPQIWHNLRRKSTSGVSVLLFISAFLGNLTYTLSIILSPRAISGDTRAEFLRLELPFIMGSAGTMLFDCIILLQWIIYPAELEVEQVIEASVPADMNLSDVDRLRQHLLHRKPRSATPLLSYQSIYSGNTSAVDDQ